jgi:hypothetical protein
MQMNIFKILIIIFVVFINNVYAENKMINGFFRSDNLELFRSIKKQFGYRPYSLISSNDGEYYGMSRNGAGIAKYSMTIENKGVLGWPLTRWPEELKNKDVADMYKLFSDPDFAQDYSYSPYQSTNPNFKQPPVMGCLSEIPLRYGDVDNNKTDELMLLLGHKDQVLDFVLFNPDQEKISFSARVIMSDIDDYHGTDSQY